MSPKQESADALLLHVHIDGIAPPIWRRLLVPAELSLGELHHVLQVVMGWDGSHLHDFRQGKGRAQRMVASTDMLERDMPCADIDVPNEYDVRVSDVLKRKGSTLGYVYDYGDNWHHVLRLEERVEDSGPMPRCTDGERAAPPEDCGGVPGYYQSLEALRSPGADPERVEWLDGWEPEHFDLDAVNVEISERLTESELCNAALSSELLDFLLSPMDFGLTNQSIERFKDAASNLAGLLSDSGEVAGGLTAPDAGFPNGVLATHESDELDGMWTVSLFESRQDFMQEEPGEAQEPRRMLAVHFQLTDLLPASMRRVVGPGVLPIPMAVLAEGVKPPNHEEMDLLSTCLEILTESISAWDTEDALPSPVEGTWKIADKMIEVGFFPDPDLSGREGDEEGDQMPLSLGFEASDHQGPFAEEEEVG